MFMYNVYTAIQKTCPHVYGVTYNTTNIIWKSFKYIVVINTAVIAKEYVSKVIKKNVNIIKLI